MITTRCTIGIHSVCLSTDCDCPCHTGEPPVDTTPMTTRERVYSVVAVVCITATLFVDGGLW